jgi:hypothetical protein
MGGGERGIRTLETVARLHTFQACAFDHSATSPLEGAHNSQAALRVKHNGPLEMAWYSQLQILTPHRIRKCG